MRITEKLKGLDRKNRKQDRNNYICDCVFHMSLDLICGEVMH